MDQLFVEDSDNSSPEPELPTAESLLEPEIPLIPAPDFDALNGSSEPESVLDVHSILQLGYQRAILEELLAEDMLVIAARGLGVESVVANLLHVLSVPRSSKRGLVILMNASSNEAMRIGEELEELQWTETEEAQLNRRFFVTSESSGMNKRKNMYQEGGIVCINSRLLVVDFLAHIVEPEQVTGLVVMHAESVSETSAESFAISLYRSQNKWGFVKCLSEDPRALISGSGFNMSPLKKMLQNMMLQKCSLWPRFHISVSQSLKPKNDKFGKANTVGGKINEINVIMTESMQRIQLALLQCLKQLLLEIKRHNPELAAASELFADFKPARSETVATDIAADDDYTRVLDEHFLRQLFALFNKSWHRVSWTTKQLISDVSMLRKLLTTIVTDDSVSFYQQLEASLHEQQKSSGVGRMSYNGSPWLLLDEATTVISFAKRRYAKREELPKWDQLSALLKEISEENSVKSNGPILIMCSSAATVSQVSQYLCDVVDLASVDLNSSEFDGHKFMSRKVRQYNAVKKKQFEVLENFEKSIKATETARQSELDEIKGNIVTPNIASADENSGVPQNNEITVSRTFHRGEVSKRRRTRGGAVVAQLERMHSARYGEDEKDDAAETIDLVKNESLENSPIDWDDDSFDADSASHFGVLSRGQLVLVAKYGDCDYSLLNELGPSHVIMYEPDLCFIRRLEVYQAENRSKQLQIFLMYYGSSVEESQYLNSIRKEKESFVKLLREKGQMSKDFGNEFRNFSEKKLSWNMSGNTRIAGGGLVHKQKISNKIIVDMREFRSALPNILFRAGFEVIPSVLTVGDYVLTPRICIERKSVPDLIQSFEKGNLFQQCSRMFKYYTTVILLIEFDENKSFALNPFLEYKNSLDRSLAKFKQPETLERSHSEVRLKLTMLLLAFPDLKLIWSPSAHKTAEILRGLKISDNADPDLATAVSLGLDTKLSRELFSGGELGSYEVNDSAIEMLKSMPGVTAENYMILVSHIRSMKELVQLDKEEIALLIGDEMAGRLHNFLHQRMN